MQIMKGYHCSSDSVNLRVLHNVCVGVCVSIWLCVFAAQGMYILPGCTRVVVQCH